MKFFVFLKGVNVGGISKVDMASLKAELEKTFKGGISTFLNSGNVIVESDMRTDAIQSAVSDAISKISGLTIRVHVKTEDDLKDALGANPFKDFDKSKTLVYFLTVGISELALVALKENKKITESYVGYKEYLFVHYADGVGRSALTTKLIDSLFASESTGRNINTIEKMLER